MTIKTLADYDEVKTRSLSTDSEVRAQALVELYSWFSAIPLYPRAMMKELLELRSAR